MARYDGDVQLTVNLTPGDVVQTAEKVSKDIENAFTKSSGKKVSPQFKSILSSLNQIYEKIGQVDSRMRELEEFRAPTEEYKQLQSTLINLEEQITQATEKANEFEDQLENLAKKQVPSDAYLDLNKQLASLEEELADLEEDRKAFFSGDTNNWTSDAIDEMQDHFNSLQQQIAETKSKMQELVDAGQAFVSGDQTSTYRQISANSAKAEEHLRSLEQEYQNLNAQRREMESSGTAYIIGTETEEYQNLTGVMANLTNKATSFLSRLYELKDIDFRSLPQKSFELLANAAKKAASAVKDVAVNLVKLTARSIAHKIKDLASSMLGLSKNTNSANNMLKVGFRTFLRYGLGIRSVYFLFRRLRKALTEGFENLAQYSGELNNTISRLMSSMTQLKNSFATAFAPLINTVAPILIQFANLVSEVVTRIGMLIATLLGETSFTRAVAVQEDYAKSLQKSASATNKESKATDKLEGKLEKVQKTLAGFDDVEILKSPDAQGGQDTSGSGSGSGSGDGGYTGPTPGEMFETVQIESGLKDLAKKLKEAWANADFTEIGRMLGDQIKEGLEYAEKILETTISPVLNKIAKSIATFLNGVLETPGLFTQLGSTIATALNTALGAVNTFVTNFHWDSLGKAISDGINGFFKKFDFTLAAETISNIALGLLTTFKTAVENVNWTQIGSDIQEFLTNIKWAEIATAVIATVQAAFSAFGDLFMGLFDGVPEAIAKWVADNSLADEGAAVVLGFLQGITDELLGIGKWLKDNIFTPFINGFKKTFGISSPATEMEPYGGYIVEGILNGILNAIKGIGDWIKKNVLKPIVDAIGIPIVTVQVAVEKAAQWASDAWEAAKMAGGTVKRTLETASQKASTWINDAYNAAKMAGGTVKRTLETASQKASGWSSDAYKAATLGKDTVTRTLSALAKKAKDWSGEAYKAATLGKDTITRTLSTIAKKAKGWSNAAYKAATLESGKTIKRTISVIMKPGNKNAEKYFKGGQNKGTPKARGGVFTHGSWRNLPQFAMGGVIKNGLQHFASGGLPGFGSLFVAGEAGPEIVGNINGRTEILNKSQIASAIYSAVMAGMATAVNSFGKFLSAQLAQTTNANISAIQAGVTALQNIAEQTLIPAITSGNVIPYSMLANSDKEVATLQDILDVLKNSPNNLTYNEIYSIIETVVRRYLNIQFYIGDEQIARHANAGNARIDRRVNPVMR